jgi:hypothetical protein
MARKIGSPAKRIELRDHLFPGLVEHIYPPPGTKGWCLMPRYMPQIINLLSERRFSGGMDLMRTYLGLWCDNYGEGFVEIDNEMTYADVAGFRGERGLRSWRDRVRKLQKLGFVETVEMGSAKIGFVGIVDPSYAVSRLPSLGYELQKGWQAQYLATLIRTGATARTVTEFAGHMLPTGTVFSVSKDGVIAEDMLHPVIPTDDEKKGTG